MQRKKVKQNSVGSMDRATVHNVHNMCVQTGKKERMSKRNWKTKHNKQSKAKHELFGETGRQRLRGEFNRNGFNQNNRKQNQ